MKIHKLLTEPDNKYYTLCKPYIRHRVFYHCIQKYLDMNEHGNMIEYYGINLNKYMKNEKTSSI